MKNTQKPIVNLLALFFMSASIAHAASHLPQQVQFNASPFKAVTIESDALTAYARPRFVSMDDAINHATSVGMPVDGVAMLTLTRSDFTVDCTGTLLSSPTGDYVLTAAHCVSDELGSNNFVTGVATFTGVDGSETITITGVNIHPDWDGRIVRGNDVAILTLTHRPGIEINRDDFDRNDKFDVRSISKEIGYGISGMRKTESALGFGKKRNGMSRYDAAADTMQKVLGWRGGRDFVRNSVFQYGLNDGRISDVTPRIIDSSIGEFADDAYVALYAGWIDSVTGGINVSGDITQTTCNRRQQMLGNC